MNTPEELRQAVDDYHRTQFGGWPWTGVDPTHPGLMGGSRSMLTVEWSTATVNLSSVGALDRLCAALRTSSAVSAMWNVIASLTRLGRHRCLSHSALEL